MRGKATRGGPFDMRLRTAPRLRFIFGGCYFSSRRDIERLECLTECTPTFHSEEANKNLHHCKPNKSEQASVIVKVSPCA